MGNVVSSRGCSDQYRDSIGGVGTSIKGNQWGIFVGTDQHRFVDQQCTGIRHGEYAASTHLLLIGDIVTTNKQFWDVVKNQQRGYHSQQIPSNKKVIITYKT